MFEAEQTTLEERNMSGFSVFMLNGLGAWRRILYFRVQTGTRTTLFNGGLVVYVFDFGAFSRFFTSAYK